MDPPFPLEPRGRPDLMQSSPILAYARGTSVAIWVSSTLEQVHLAWQRPAIPHPSLPVPMSSSEEEREVCIESAAEVGKTRPHAGTKDIQCSICTRMYEVSRCINAGDKVYASWRCKPCHNATRLLERAIESKGQQAKEKAQLLRKVRRDQWRRLVAWVRIAHPDDEMNEYDKDESIMGEDTGPSAGMQKAVNSSSYVVEQRTSVMMMTKRQFKAHFIQTEMFTKDEAETFWHNCLTNKDIYRETEDGSTSLAVKLPKVYSGSTLVARARQAEERKDIANIAECAKQVRSAPDLSTRSSRATAPSSACSRGRMSRSRTRRTARRAP